MGETDKITWLDEIDDGFIKESQNYNLDDIYEHAHSELSLQQSKRDQIITIYLALCSFFLPFALGEEVLSMTWKGIIFLLLGVVGVLFSFITVRYRDYKEVYWTCCQTITVLQSFKPESLNKDLVQKAFHYSLEKKGKKFLTEEGRLNRGMFVKKNLFSSETLHYAIIALMASFICGLGVGLLLSFLPILSISVGILCGIIAFVYLLRTYFKTLIQIYSVLDTALSMDKRDELFKSCFKKAWFLHFYYDKKKA